MSLWSWAAGLLPFPVSRFDTYGDVNSPATMSPIVAAWQPELYLCRTLYGGWESVKRESTALLPQHPGEDNTDYQIRLSRPAFYNAFGRTVRALSGTVFKTDPEPQDVPTEIQALFDDDIDLQGTKGTVFLKHTFNDGLITGLSGIFVDMPEADANITRLEAQEANLRPFWTFVRKDDIVSVRVDVVNGHTVLGQLVFKERVQERAGQFGVKVYDRLRVLRREPDAVTFETWEQNTKQGKWVLVDGSQGQFRGVTEIPFAPIYTGRVDFMDASPPLIDLANLNLLHYQVNSDLHHAVHIANVPMLFGVGMDSADIHIGPNRAYTVPVGDASTKLMWLETTGAALGSTRAILADIEEQMSNVGLGMLQRKSRAAETAQKATIDKQEQDSTLASIVTDLEDGVELALYYTAQFLGDQEGKGGRFEFARDFQVEPMSADPTENQGGAPAPKDPKRPGETNNPKTTS